MAEQKKSVAYKTMTDYIAELALQDQVKDEDCDRWVFSTSDKHSKLIDVYLNPPKWEVGDILMLDNVRYVVAYKNKHGLPYMRELTTAGPKQYTYLTPTWEYEGLKYDPEYISAKMTGNEYDPFVGKRAKPRVKTLIQDCKNNTIKGWPVCEYASAKEVGPMKDSIKLKNCQTIYDGIVKFCRTLEGKTFYVPNELADHLYWGGLSVKQINEFVFSSTNFTKVTINAFVGEKPNSHWNRDGRSLNINMSIDDGKKDRVEILLLREIIGRAWNQKTSDHTGEVQNTYIETYKVFTEILKKYFFTSL